MASVLPFAAARQEKRCSHSKQDQRASTHTHTYAPTPGPDSPGRRAVASPSPGCRDPGRHRHPGTPHPHSYAGLPRPGHTDGLTPKPLELRRARLNTHQPRVLVKNVSRLRTERQSRREDSERTDVRWSGGLLDRAGVSRRVDVRRRGRDTAPPKLKSDESVLRSIPRTAGT